MKKFFLLAVTFITFNNICDNNQIKNEFVNTNKKEDLAQIGQLINDAIDSMYQALPKEIREDSKLKKSMQDVRIFFNDANSLELALKNSLNDMEIKAVLILLNRLSNVEQLQYLPLMLNVILVKFLKFCNQNKDQVNVGLKGVMQNCSDLMVKVNRKDEVA